MKKLIITFLLIIASSFAFSQGGNMGGGSWNDCGPGNWYDTGGAGADYTNNELITETYCSNVAGQCIQFTFTSFSTEAGWDDLTIYDGPNTGSPLIGVYDGVALPNGGVITSTSGCLTFVFDSDGSVTRPGWVASYTCVPCPLPTCSDGIQNQGETGIDCGGPCPPCPPVIIPVACTNATYNLTTLSTITFYDDGGPGGLPCADQLGGGNYCNCNCFTTTTICAAPGEWIIANFSEFAMWNTTSGWDWMKIYDGPNTTFPILYDNSSTGPQNPMGDCGIGLNILNFCSTNQCLTFEFWATSVVNRAGWVAAVSSVSVSCILPIELLEFSGYNKNDVNILHWSTATEINNDYFTLERSVDGLNWLTIEQVEGSGNSNTEVSYEYIDDTYPNEINYYRLSQTDFDGKSETFNMIGIINLKSYETSDYTIVNLMGQEVSDNFSGIRIIIWESGERELLPVGSKNPNRN